MHMKFMTLLLHTNQNIKIVDWKIITTMQYYFTEQHWAGGIFLVRTDVLPHRSGAWLYYFNILLVWIHLSLQLYILILMPLWLCQLTQILIDLLHISPVHYCLLKHYK